jgi:DnaJ-class molecular chaperone
MRHGPDVKRLQSQRRRRSCKVFLSPRVYYYVALILIVLSTQPRLVASRKSYYDILGVPNRSDAKDITKAYRKLALKHHPDKGGNEEEFKEISKAYGTLSDPEQRKLYDAYGEAGVSSGGPSAGSFPFSGSGGDPFAGARQFGGAGAAGGSNPFQGMFAGGQGGQGFHSEHFSAGKDGRNSANIDLSQILHEMMGGSRAARGFQRSGTGTSSSSSNPQSFARPVTCTLEELATGAIKKLKVTFQGEENVQTIQLKPGWKEGTKITFDGRARGHPTMIYVIEEAPHKYLRRDGNNLHYTCWISESQTNGGIHIKVPLPTGDVWSKTIPKSDESAVSNGEKLVIPSKGMPVKGGPQRGDLIVEFRVRRSTTS